MHDFLQSLKPSTIKLGLKRTRTLLKKCGDPQNKLKIIQVAGTNGKGSVCAMLESIYRTSGLKTGLFTSPHLVRLNERIRVNGMPVSDNHLEKFVDRFKEAIIAVDASFFETLTAFAFWNFCREKVDIAVMETGLGGRLDSVTACSPLVTVMTKISLDHVEILGDSLEKITIEKAGILKEGIPCYSAPQNILVQKTLLNSAEKASCSIEFSENATVYGLNLRGEHQRENAALAELVVRKTQLFPIDNQIVKAGLSNMVWFGRYQNISNKPKVIFDVGHNHDGISAFLSTFNNEEINGRSILIIALQNRKNIRQLSIKIATQFDKIYCGEIRVKNYMPEKELMNQLGNPNKAHLIGEIDHEVISNIVAKLTSEDCLAIIGSHYFGETVSRVFKISFDNL